MYSSCMELQCGRLCRTVYDCMELQLYIIVWNCSCMELQCGRLCRTVYDCMELQLYIIVWLYGIAVWTFV